MSNLPLKPLKWTQKNLNPLAELELTAYSALHEYVITEPKKGKFELKKTRLSRPDKKSEFLPYFDTVTEAQDWAWAHYQRSMQPYVKPSPTWIDASKQLPSEDGRYLVCFGMLKGVANCDVDNFDTESKKWDFFDSHDLPSVIAWVPIPEFKQGE